MNNNQNYAPHPPNTYSNMPPPQSINTMSISVKNPITMNMGPSVNYLAGPAPRMNCMYCNQETDSICIKQTGRTTFIWCFITSFIGCCCIPFCIQQCKDSEIKCVVCHQPKLRVQAPIC